MINRVGKWTKQNANQVSERAHVRVRYIWGLFSGFDIKSMTYFCRPDCMFISGLSENRCAGTKCMRCVWEWTYKNAKLMHMQIKSEVISDKQYVSYDNEVTTSRRWRRSTRLIYRMCAFNCECIHVQWKVFIKTEIVYRVVQLLAKRKYSINNIEWVCAR